MKSMVHCLLFPVFGFCLACVASGEETVSVEIFSPSAKPLFPATLKVETLSTGYRLAEGPVWNKAEDCLLFVDIPANSVYKWTKQDGVSVYLNPSGQTGFAPSLKNGVIGANGLAFDQDQSLVLCQHGDRRIAKLIKSDGGKSEFATLASHFQGKRFNSPNDLTIAKNGDIFFTDPPGGYLDLENSDFEKGKVVFDTRHKELPFQGVYHYQRGSRKISLVTKEMNRPNGITLSRDGKRLYVGNAEGESPHVMQFSTETYAGKLFFDGPFREQDKGVVDGFAYSKALAEFGGAWDYAALNLFLAKPKAYISGTKMNFAGLKKPQDRANMIAYLRQQADAPAALPSETEIAAESGS